MIFEILGNLFKSIALQYFFFSRYDVNNAKIYNSDKHDIQVVTFIVANDLNLRKIILDGGGKLLCQLWYKDVLEYRRNIQQAFEHLLKTDLVFCAEHDVEFHIWKIAFYNLVSISCTTPYYIPYVIAVMLNLLPFLSS